MNKDVIPAPAWFRAQREYLRSLPPPTIERVRKQMRASANLTPEQAAIKIRKQFGKTLETLAY